MALPLLAPLVPLALTFAPELARALAGPRAEAVAQVAADVVRSVTGTDLPDSARTRLAGDADLQARLRIELARIASAEAQAEREAELAAFRASLADVASARSQTVELARAGSSIAWGAPVVSALIVVAYAGVLAVFLLRPLSLGPEAWAVVNILVGTLTSCFTVVTAYWLGSSRGSATKEQKLDRILSASGERAGPLEPRPSEPRP
jgi:hypothetical protein